MRACLLQYSLKQGAWEEILLHSQRPSRLQTSSPLPCERGSRIAGAAGCSSALPLKQCLLGEAWRGKRVSPEPGSVTCSGSRTEAELLPSLFGCCGACSASQEGFSSFSPIHSQLISTPLAELRLPETTGVRNPTGWAENSTMRNQCCLCHYSL